MQPSTARLRVLTLLVTCAILALAHADRPFISEFVAVGNKEVVDEDDDAPDWLEIHNPLASPINLEGYHLTDDPDDLTKWTFPSVPVEPGGYIGVFASDKDRTSSILTLHANFRLSSEGEYLALVAPDGVTVVSEYAPTFPPQIPGFSYGIEGSSPDGPRGYFSPPSPVAPNGPRNPTPLFAPEISPSCATFEDEVEVTLTPLFPGGETRYTTDGTVPTDTSPLYTGPVTLTETTHLRTRVFDPQSGEGGVVASGHFQKLASSSNLSGITSPQSFTSNLPIMIVENFGAGSIPAPGRIMQTARVFVHEVDPFTGRSSLANPPDACFRIGIRRRGQSSSGFDKPQYRVELREEDDSDLDFPLLGLPAESDWVFNGPWTDKSLVRNAFSFELGRTIGNEAPGTRHFEMFLSTNGGDLLASEYVGVYVLFESVKLSDNRTDLAELTPEDTSEPDLTGGYMMRFEPPGIAGQGIRATNWRSLEIIEPQAANLEQRNYVGQYFDDFVATLGWSRGSGRNDNGPVNPDPVTGYPAFIDVDSFVNHFLISELGRDQDAYVRSDYMFKDRNGKLHKGPLWDHNLIMGTGCCFDNRNPMGWQYRDNYNRGGRDHSYEPDWFVPLMRDPDFRQQVIDRWSELRRGGPFELDQLFARLDGQADPLAEAAERNFTRWNTLRQNGPGFPSPSTNTWEEQIDFIKQWLTERTDWIDLQFPMVPGISPAGGTVLQSDEEVEVQSELPIYYTTDGSDPRLPGGGINPEAVVLPPSLGSIPATFFPAESPWTFLDDGSDQGPSEVLVSHPSYNRNNWKHPDFDDTPWTTGEGVFGFGGIGSAPRVDFGTTLERFANGTQIRAYYFRKSFEVEDVTDVFTMEARVLRDDGVIIYLNGHEVGRSNIPEGVVLGFDDLTGTDGPRGDEESTYFPVTIDPAFLVNGTNVLAVTLHQQTGGSSDVGFDLELVGTVDPGDAPTIAIPQSILVRARSRDDDGEWSGPHDALFVVGEAAGPQNLIVSEINYHPAPPSATELTIDPSLRERDFEWIELRNVGTGTTDLSGVTFSDGISARLSVGSSLAPGAYGVLVANREAFTLRYGNGIPVLGTYDNQLSNDGEQVRVDDLSGSPIVNFIYNDVWYRESDGQGFTLNLRNENAVPANYSDPLSWESGSSQGGTPGGPGVTLSEGFLSWQAANFDEAERADPLVSGPLADPEGDSLTNLLEYAMGLDPRANNSDSLPVLTFSYDDLGQRNLELTFQRKKGLTGVIFGMEVSQDLVTWNLSSIPGPPFIDNGDGTEMVTLRHPLPIFPPTPRLMVRLKILSQ